MEKFAGEVSKRLLMCASSGYKEMQICAQRSTPFSDWFTLHTQQYCKSDANMLKIIKFKFKLIYKMENFVILAFTFYFFQS